MRARHGGLVAGAALGGLVEAERRRLDAAVDDPEAAARIYAAARLSVDLDTLRERQVLTMLAEALDVPGEAVARLERALAA